MKQTSQSQQILDTVIAEGVRVKGNLHVETNLWLGGTIEGNIYSNGEVALGPQSNVTGNITARSVVIEGKVSGNVKASAKLVILSTGQIIGNADVGGIVIEDGGVLVGLIKMPEPIEDPKIDENSQ